MKPATVTPEYLYYMNEREWLLAAIIIIVMITSVKTRKLSVGAAFTGALFGVCLYIGAGFTGVAFMAIFFLLGTLATSWQIQKKKERKIAEENLGRRQPGQVIANAGVAALLGLLIYLFPQQSVLFSVMMASAFSSATADTLSSELGNVYGKRFYNILTFRKDRRGLDGVISLEGTFAGICGSIVIAVIYMFGFSWNGYVFFVIILSGIIGNLSDSLLGAAFERKGVLRNDAVNFLNTLIASLAALLLF